jgi:hypothetical protein
VSINFLAASETTADTPLCIAVISYRNSTLTGEVPYVKLEVVGEVLKIKKEKHETRRLLFNPVQLYTKASTKHSFFGGLENFFSSTND